MKYNKGFVGIGAIIAIIAVLVVGGVVYFATKTSTFPSQNTGENNYYPQENQNSGTNVPTTNPESQTNSDDQNGEYIGYIKSVSSSSGNYSLKIDYIQWITPCVTNPQTNYCMNGYEIVNSNPLIRIFPISNNAAIKMQTWSHGAGGDYNFNEVVSLSLFKGVINGTTIPPSYTDMAQYNPSPYTGWYNTGTTTRGIPFWITLNNGIITDITEQYIP